MKCGGTFDVGQVFTITTIKDTSVKRMKFGCVIPTVPLGHEKHAQFQVVAAVSADKSTTTTLMGFEPTTFPPAFPKRYRHGGLVVKASAS